jgi:hypothetical protein
VLTAVLERFTGSELFGKAKGTISEHIKHIFEDGELDENAVVRFFRITAADG